MHEKKIAIIGTGYVGLVHGATLASHGHTVVCLDIDASKIQSLQAGLIPFYEPDLKELVDSGVHSEKLSFTTNYSDAISGAHVCFLCLPTPSSADGSCDLSYILSAASTVAQHIQDYLVIVNRSTVPVGTSQAVKAQIQKTFEQIGTSYPFDVVSNPEFLREGSAVADSLNPTRILVGAENEKAHQVMEELYSCFSLPKEQMIQVDVASSELAKYAANTMLAARLSMMNTLARLCEKAGGDIEQVKKAIGLDPRIGSAYLSAGLGFGGSCLPKDVRALLKTLDEHEVDSSILQSIMHINNSQRELFFNKVLNYFGSLEGKTLAIWGLSFKPNTDDMREAPSLFLIEKFLNCGATLQVYDPVSNEKARQILGDRSGITYCNDPYEAATHAHAVVLVTEWGIFKEIELEKVGSLLKDKVLFDGRNQFDPSVLEAMNFTYLPTGIATSAQGIPS